MTAPNLFEPSFDAEQDRHGFAWRRARLGRQAGAQRLGASLFELAPGQAAFPYHAHFGNEEMLIVVSGRPHLRSPAGWRRLEEGELVAFPAGPEGAHQVHNGGEEPARVLIVSQMISPEVIHYPDSGKLAAREHPPGSAEQGTFAIFQPGDAVDYFDGEPEPGTVPEGGA